MRQTFQDEVTERGSEQGWDASQREHPVSPENYGEFVFSWEGQSTV